MAKLTNKDILDLGWKPGMSTMSMKSPTSYYWGTEEKITHWLNFWEWDRDYLTTFDINPGTLTISSNDNKDWLSGYGYSKAHLAEIMKEFKLN